MIEISVIMPVYNETLTELKSSIKSILTQSYKKFEFIIVDDNPKSFNIKNYLLNERNQDSRIKLIFNKQNLGSMISADKGLNKATGNFIARMDADDIAKRNRLQMQLQFCTKYDLDVSCCNYQCFYNNHVNKKSSYPNITQVNQYKIRRVMSHINIAIGPTLFFKRNILNKIGLYRNILCEDYDLAARALIYGYRMGYLSDSLIYKRDRVNNLSSLNALKEFVICDTISKYLRLYEFTKETPLEYIRQNLKDINHKNEQKYLNFMKYSKLCKEHKSIFNVLNKYFYAFSSGLMSKRSIITHFSNLIQDLLLR